LGEYFVVGYYLADQVRTLAICRDLMYRR
jgi:hypothetical protein